MAYPETYSSMRDLIEQKLQDTSNNTWTAPELDLYITEGLREIAQYHPHILRFEFNLESRRGTATSTTTDSLTDATNDQFLASDVGKWIYNQTDRTWAEVTTYTDAENLVLSKDIMVSGEGYQMFNKGCSDRREFNIRAGQNADSNIGSRVMDYLWIDKIEYPILQNPPSYLQEGQWEEKEGQIIYLKVDGEPDNTKNTSARDEVWVYFACRHKLSQLGTYVGKVDLIAGYAAGSTSIVVDDLTESEAIEKGQEFTIDGVRGIYVADHPRTVTGGELTASFWPPLLDAATNDDNVRFVSNTMDFKLEGLFADLVTGRALIRKAPKYINLINKGGSRVYSDTYVTGKAMYDSAIEELESIRGFTAPSIALP